MKHKYIILSNLDELFTTDKGECLIETHHIARVANHIVDTIKMITDCNVKVMLMLPFICGPTENLDAFLEATRLMVNILVSNPDLVGKWTREVTIFQTSEWLLEVCTSASKGRYSKEKLLRIENGQVKGWTRLGVCEVSARLSENLRTWVTRDLNPEVRPILFKQPVSLADLSRVLGCQYVVSPSPSKGNLTWNKSIVSPPIVVAVPNPPPLELSAAAWAQAKTSAKLKKKASQKQLLGPNTKTKVRPSFQPVKQPAPVPKKRHRRQKKGFVNTIPIGKRIEQPWNTEPFSKTQKMGF